MRATIGATILGPTLLPGSRDLDRPGQGVPAVLADVAGVEPDVFGRHLAEASVPGGVEMRQGDRSTRTMRELPLRDGRTMSLRDLAAAFNAAHGDDRAEIAGGFSTSPRSRGVRATWTRTSARTVSLSRDC